MATRRVVRPRARNFGRPRPGGTWTRTVGVPGNVAVSSKVLVGTFALSNPGIGETIRRTLGNISVVSDQGAADESQSGAWGLIVVSDLAGAAGAAAIPGPFTDMTDDGWFVWGGWSQFVKLGSTVSNPHIYQHQYDSRAMRRMEEGFLIALMVENASASHVFNFAVTLSLYATRH